MRFICLPFGYDLDALAGAKQRRDTSFRVFVLKQKKEREEKTKNAFVMYLRHWMLDIGCFDDTSALGGAV